MPTPDSAPWTDPLSPYLLLSSQVWLGVEQLQAVEDIAVIGETLQGHCWVATRTAPMGPEGFTGTSSADRLLVHGQLSTATCRAHDHSSG